MYNFYNCKKNDENIFKKKPKNNKFAYVYIIMKSTDLYVKYILGTLVSAYSLRKQNTKFDIVVLLTPDVEKKYYKMFKLVFDKIIMIDYYFPNKKFTNNIENERWKYLYTKIKLFKLTMYNKILFINANLLPLKNYDYIFNYKAPAGYPIFDKNIFTSDVNEIKKSKILNREKDFIKAQNRILCKYKNVKQLNKKYKNLFENFDDYWIQGSLFLFKPSKKVYKDMKEILNGNNTHYNNLIIPNDERFFTYYFKDKWTFMDNRFNSFIFQKKYLYMDFVYSINFQIKKPFLKIKKKDMRYPEIKKWLEIYKELIIRYSILKKLEDINYK